ncbi:exodeoxyribonuclease VII small subunit [Agaribacterium haliotis]|uniref:exodeoxyribonuclease VII small subunit n=1 Tax=Agaribacterium haliotis TaxID=2013869 RepID=UPI000BB52EA3|nr:exodeoxyribonuclease VII small subunit [Agaribacterium haliotis]
MSKKAAIKNFEQNLGQLEALVQALESGELSLEEALSHFEKGIKMSRECQQALNDAEQKVQVLLEQNGQLTLSEFEPEQ